MWLNSKCCHNLWSVIAAPDTEINLANLQFLTPVGELLTLTKLTQTIKLLWLNPKWLVYIAASVLLFNCMSVCLTVCRSLRLSV